MSQIFHKFVDPEPDIPGFPGTKPSDWNAVHVDSAGNAVSVRTVLMAATTYYVSATGNDSNNGSIGLPWLTLQHAIDFISSSIDIASQNVTINIGPGTFVGFGVKGSVGGGIVQFIGAGHASTTITNGPNDGVYNFGETVSMYNSFDTHLAIDAVNLDQISTNPTVIQAAPGTHFTLGNIITFAAADISFTRASTNQAGFIEVAFNCFFTTVAGNYALPSGITAQSCFLIQCNAVVFDSGTWTIAPGTLTITDAFCDVGTFSAGGQYISVGSSFSGTAAGLRFRVTTDGAIQTTLENLTLFPGSLPGTLDHGGVYS